MTERSTEHTTLTIERHFKAPLPRVFGAWAVAENKRQWFACHGDWTPLDFQLDFRPGGSESNRVASTDGVIHAYQARYIDIVPNERIIYSYDMHLDEIRISVSLATIELRPEKDGTLLVFTEQGAFLDGYDDAGSRERGTRDLLEALGASLAD